MLNTLGALACGGLTLVSTTVTSVNGTVPIFIIAPAMAIAFAIRAIGNVIARGRGAWGMPWGARILSWFPFGLSALLLGSAGSLFSVAAFAAFIVLDAASGFVKREGQEVPKKKKRDWRPFWFGTGITVYLGATAAFYLFIGRFFPYGVLATWTVLAFGFALLVRLAIVGTKATERHLYAPPEHRLHEMREREVIDPQRSRAESVVASLRASGDAGPFLELVREAATSADLPETDIASLEQRIITSFARAGTRRDEDVLAALTEVENILALRGERRGIPIKKETTL